MGTADAYAEACAAWRWQVPATFNIAQACVTRWADDPDRVALLWEDEDGAASTHTFAELERQANRLANALAATGIARGDRVALILPQRPETVVAHLAVYKLGAVAVPLSFLFGPEALGYRLADSGAKAAFVDPQSLPNLTGLRDRLPALKTVIGVAGARESFTTAFNAFVANAADSHPGTATAFEDPALLIYTSGTTGPPKGALMPHCCLIGNLPGFIHSHDGFPQPGDRFWSPADWAWTGGLMDALLPTLYFGLPILGFRGRFDAERAYDLIARYRIRNTFLFPTALKLMMKADPRPRERYDLQLRSMMSAGESVGTTVFEWTRDALGVTVNEMFGQTEMNYIVGNCSSMWPARAGSMGRPYPGHRVALLDDTGREVPCGEPGDVAVSRIAPDGARDPVFFLGYWGNEEATRSKFTGDWCRTGDVATMDEDGYLWYQGRADDVFKVAGYRIGPSEIENCLVRHPAVANAAVVPVPDATRGNLVKAFVVLSGAVHASEALVEELQQHVRHHLAPYEIPRYIEFIEALPMTTTGKVQRRLLRERANRAD